MAPTSPRITGPSGALDMHLRMFRQSDTEIEYVAGALRAAQDGRRMAIDSAKSPNLIRWLTFANTYSKPSMVYDTETGEVTAAPHADEDMAYLFDGRSQMEKEYILTEGQVSGATVQTGLSMATAEHRMLDMARTHYITAEMAALVDEAAELAEPEPLFETDLPCDSGLLVFEAPHVLDDLHPYTGDPLGEKIMPIRAIGWHRNPVGKRDMSGMSDGIVMVHYTLAEDYNAIFVPRIDEILNETSDPHPYPGDIWPVEFHPWAFGTEWSAVGHLGDQQHGKIVSPVAYNRRWLLTFFRIMWQRIIEPEQWHPTRQGRREIERSKRKPTKPDGETFSVLVLRRFIEPRVPERGQDPDDWADWPYPYRIPVEPHWRRQHYPSLGPARNADGSFNVDSHRRIYISRHARGPEHLPILERHNVTAVVR